MSVLGGYPEPLSNRNDLQIWNNAAFDNGGDSEDLSSNSLIKSSSWSPLKPDSLDSSSFSSKENQSPSGLPKSPVSVKPPAFIRPLHPSNSLKDPTKIGILKEVGVEKPTVGKGKKIDEVIEQIENEISRLSARLEELRLEKAEQNKKNLETQGRMVAAKFMEPPKQNVKKGDFELKKTEETATLSSSRTKIQRRGFSMGPTEIMTAANSSKSRQLGKQEIISITPIQSTQNRRKSCFWKLQGIEEENEKKVVGGVSRGKNLSLSPKSRKLMCKTQVPRQAVTTVGSKKGIKKDDHVLSSIQPKKLFMKDGGEKSVPAKMPLKPGRVVASRYNQSTVSSAMRKRSLPENDKEESKRYDKKRASIGKLCGTEGRVKKRWEIPGEIVIPKKLDLDYNENEASPPSVSVVMPGMLPRIRAVRCVNETPRDSGPAKRVAELVGRKSYFSCVDEEEEEEEEPSVCQALSFEEDFEDEN